MPIFAPGATFIGASTPLGGSAASTPVVAIPAGYGHLFVYHYIAGYSNSGIAIIQFGTTSTAVDTGNNYSCVTSHFILAATIQASASRISTNGIWVANDAVTTGRRGLHQIHNPSGAPTTCDSKTATYGVQNPTTAASAYTTQSIVVGAWFNNAQALSVAMNAGTGVNLIAGSFISVYGIPGLG